MAQAAGGGEVQSDVQYERSAFTNLSRAVHSGHSLTDTYTYGHGWPGDLIRLRDSLFNPDDSGSDVYIKRSTVPGSTITYRWEYETEARTDIDDFDALMITEAGPLLHLDSQVDWVLEGIDSGFDHFLRFCANTIENGAGNEVILWSIWPAWDMWDGEDPNWNHISFTGALVEYGQYFETLAAFGTYKMHELYTLPEGWKVWLVPGHRWWLRAFEDIGNNLVPTITHISDLFDDDIHPDDGAAYGLACFVTSCLWQIDLREQTGVYVPAGIDPDLREYFWRIAWELAIDYAHVGMNGTSKDGSQWDADTDPDFMPDWTLAAPDTAPGWAVMVKVPIPVPKNTAAPAITGTLENGQTISLSTGTWTPTPDEVEQEWFADASPVDSSASLDLTGREGEVITGRTRARMTEGEWSDWEPATGGGEVQPVSQ